MSTFGDFEVDDAYDPTPPDPEQVARRLHLLGRLVDELSGAEPEPDYDALSPEEQARVAAHGYFLVAWLDDHPDHDIGEIAQALHERRIEWGSGQRSWDELNDDERAIAVALLALVLAWLTREGAIS